MVLEAFLVRHQQPNTGEERMQKKTDPMNILKL
jgi:hypothetical protein